MVIHWTIGGDRFQTTVTAKNGSTQPPNGWVNEGNGNAGG